jgi:hypothetical protein
MLGALPRDDEKKVTYESDRSTANNLQRTPASYDGEMGFDKVVRFLSKDSYPKCGEESGLQRAVVGVGR